MYESIKEWLDLPVVIYPFIRRSGTGTKTFGEGINTFCYAQGEVVTVKNASGVEVVSNTQLYFDGCEHVKVTDKVLFDGAESEIQSISTFYRDGKADLKVVYL